MFALRNGETVTCFESVTVKVDGKLVRNTQTHEHKLEDMKPAEINKGDKLRYSDKPAEEYRLLPGRRVCPARNMNVYIGTRRNK